MGESWRAVGQVLGTSLSVATWSTLLYWCTGTLEQCSHLVHTAPLYWCSGTLVHCCTALLLWCTVQVYMVHCRYLVYMVQFFTGAQQCTGALLPPGATWQKQQLQHYSRTWNNCPTSSLILLLLPDTARCHNTEISRDLEQVINCCVKTHPFAFI